METAKMVFESAEFARQIAATMARRNAQKDYTVVQLNAGWQVCAITKIAAKPPKPLPVAPLAAPAQQALAAAIATKVTKAQVSVDGVVVHITVQLMKRWKPGDKLAFLAEPTPNGQTELRFAVMGGWELIPGTSDSEPDTLKMRVCKEQATKWGYLGTPKPKKATQQMQNLQAALSKGLVGINPNAVTNYGA